MNYRLASAISKQAWAIEENYAQSQYPVIASLFGLSPVAVEFDVGDAESVTEIFSPGSNAPKAFKSTSFDNVPKGSIAIINLKGSLLKDDQVCGSIGMESIGRIIKNADASPNVSGILLNIDSPGGTVDGTVTLSDIVSGTEKPIYAFANGLMASAALWIGASADRVIAATPKTSVGSVGVLLSFADLQPAYEQMGVKFHLITADKSQDKIKSFLELRKGNYDDYKANVLNPIANDFIAHIKTKRPGVRDDQLTGKLYFAENALGSLVDEIGNLEHALSQLQNHITRREQNLNVKSNNVNSMINMKHINGILGELESTEEGVFLNEEQLQLLENGLAAVYQLKDDLALANSSREKAESGLETANQTIAGLKNQVESLNAAAGEETATIISSTETIKGEHDGNVTRADKGFVENLDAVESEFLK